MPIVKNKKETIMDWNQFWESFKSWLTTDGLNAVIKIVIALIIMFVSFKLINLIARRILRRCDKKNIDKTISHTLINIFKLALKIVITICLVGFVGIDTSGIAALIASLGVCIGLAVNGALSNFAGGIMIIITRPFKIDDYIEACGYSGTVEEIRITQTKLITPDNKVVFIPNGTLHASEIVNYSTKDTRRLDLTFSIGYADDFNKAKELILDICDKHELIFKEPAPFVRMKNHGASSIDIVTRVWLKSADYWTVNFDLLETVKKAFDENGIEIPFNQLDVHVKKD